MTEMLMSGKVTITVAYAIGQQRTFEAGQWTLELIGNRVVASKFNDGARTHMVVFPEDAIVSVYLESKP